MRLEAHLAVDAHAKHHVCVAVLDLDNLKPVNDTRGHATGDETLQLLVKIARAVKPDAAPMPPTTPELRKAPAVQRA